ncbi:restriction endonuclease [Gimesia chilikensis]|uniref:restriction endonuclease n=1 Tax=Gimesia chilikensis TaxID=2605989 RepID=UPI0011EE60E0|nr:restriction endonuclease [Gimesia chilikensis]KAA0141023.1 restriction endonuclease [Gimesia chilikensis]
MTDLQRYKQYEAGALCSVAGCDALAEFEVYLYDYYIDTAVEFFEQDLTCPFLCKSHMEQNEAEADGERRPRGQIYYPFSNGHYAQGYTKYAPLASVFPVLFDATGQPFTKEVVIAYQTINDELIQFLSKHPDKLHDLDPRRFEELVAELFRKQGFQITLTPQTRDGGKDIYALKHDQFGKSLYLIECKRYAKHNKVGVETLRSLYGVATVENATKGIIATTSSFTKDAIDFASPLEYKLSLRDFDALSEWLIDYTTDA